MSETTIKGFSTYAESSVQSPEQPIAVAAPVQEVPQTETLGTVSTEIPSVPDNNAMQEPVIAQGAEIISEDTINFEAPTFEPNGEKVQAIPNQPQTQNIDDFIKTADKKEILKKLGFNDFQIKLAEYVDNGGTEHEFMQSQATDWNKIDDLSLIKSDYQKQFPNFTPQQIEKYVNKKYGISEFANEEEKDDAMLMLSADAYALRQRKIQEQSQFKFPERQVQHQQAQQPQVDPAEIEKAQKLQQYFNNHPSTQGLVQSKRVAIQLPVEGAKPINYNIDPQLVMGVLFDPKVNDQFGKTQSGEPDVQLAYELALFKMNPTQFKKDIYNAGKQAGHRVEVEKAQNISKPNGTPQMPSKETKAEAWANRAKISTYSTPYS